MDKPPVGLKPEGLHNSHVNSERVLDIVSAMKRYSDKEMEIPREWIDELYRRMPLLCGA